MPVSLTRRKRSSSLDSLTQPELMFVRELIADDLWRPVEAARRAGYSSPGSASTRLQKKPAIARALGREQRRRLERLDLKADEVLHMLATGLFFNPLSLFKPSGDGKWVVEDLDQIPDEIGRCVEKVKAKTISKMDDEGNVVTETYFELELMGKTKLLELAMKHCGVSGSEKVELSGKVDLEHGLGASLGELLMNIEHTRKGQIIDMREED